MQAIIKKAILATINDYGLDRIVAYLSFAGTMIILITFFDV